MWKEYNPNPKHKNVGDCAIRAIAAALGISWDMAYEILTEYGYEAKNLPNADVVWGAVLRDRGFIPARLPECPLCYSVDEFSREHPKGVYVLGTGTHVVTVIDGDYYDTWDSGDEVPIICWRAV